MNFKFSRGISISLIGLASLTLVAGETKAKNISCDGLDFWGSPISFKANKEKVVIKMDDSEYETKITDKSEVTVEGSKIVIRANDEWMVEEFGKGPYELSLKTCPQELTPAIQYFIP